VAGACVTHPVAGRVWPGRHAEHDRRQVRCVWVASSAWAIRARPAAARIDA